MLIVAVQVGWDFDRSIAEQTQGRAAVEGALARLAAQRERLVEISMRTVPA